MSTLKEWTPLKVKWNDAFSKRGWWKVEDLPNLGYKVENVGWYVNSNEEFLFLSNAQCPDDGMVTDAWGIPWGMIKKVEKI